MIFYNKIDVSGGIDINGNGNSGALYSFANVNHRFHSNVFYVCHNLIIIYLSFKKLQLFLWKTKLKRKTDLKMLTWL